MDEELKKKEKDLREKYQEEIDAERRKQMKKMSEKEKEEEEKTREIL